MPIDVQRSGARTAFFPGLVVIIFELLTRRVPIALMPQVLIRCMGLTFPTFGLPSICLSPSPVDPYWPVAPSLFPFQLLMPNCGLMFDCASLRLMDLFLIEYLCT